MEAHKDRDFKIISARWVDQKLQNLGFYADRLMWWCNTEPSNFGDWVGPAVFQKRRGVWPKFAPIYLRPNRAPVHLTAGSILDSCRTPDVAIVWGTGIMNSSARFSAPREIRAVRGPLTAARCRELGYKCPNIFGDPGIVLPKFFPKTLGSSFQLGIIPHFADQELAARAIERSSEVKIIDVTRSVAEVVSDIQSCEQLVSSSLHGVIVSHAFGRPCAWVRFGDTLAGDGTKFHDYFGSVGIFDHPGAITIDPTVSIPELKMISRKSPTPDLSVIADKLLEVCPF